MTAGDWMCAFARRWRQPAWPMPRAREMPVAYRVWLAVVTTVEAVVSIWIVAAHQEAFVVDSWGQTAISVLLVVSTAMVSLRA